MNRSIHWNPLYLKTDDLKVKPLTKSPMGTEDTLVRARQLDSTALAQIHDLYYPDVYRYVRYRLNDEQLSEDISSEVFLQLLDALHRQRGPEKSLRGWLFGTASNLVNDHLRKRYSHPVENIEPGENALIDGNDPGSSYQGVWEQGQVRKAMRKLTSNQQNVLALRFANEYSLDETADAIGKSVSAVKALQFRAIASLRRLLQEEL